jgi:hypothetical protein
MIQLSIQKNLRILNIQQYTTMNKKGKQALTKLT